MTEHITVTVNGTTETYPPHTTIDDLVATRGIPADGTAIAVGQVVIPKGEWMIKKLSHGDTVEILTAVQGG